jgi:hypothetical protein
MLDAATVVDLVLDRDNGVQGQALDHRQSPHRDSASSLTPLKECGQRQYRDDQDLHDIICDTDAHGRIKNHCQERERAKQEQHNERDYDYYGPFYNQPH